MSKFMTRQLFPPFITGVLMTINFAIFWAIPVAGMGMIYKALLRDRIVPIYNYLESNRYVRWFASTFIYSKEKYADYFVLSFALLIQCAFTIPLLFYWQLTYGYLPAWMIAWYYCTWVGFGGSGMGTAYALAHKEGHDRQFYKPWVSAVFGNIFENGLGLFFGNIPWNFTTSHCKVHHATNGGMGDTFYEWDFVRCDPGYFMTYVTRILLHTTGYSSLRFLYANGEKEIADKLMTGVYKYVSAAVVILAITRSPSFLFWVYIQPFLCMTYFLALINIGFHGFIEFDENGKTIPCVDSTAIVDGEDDFFGEDDHMTHHYNINVYFKDLPEYQRKQYEEWAKYHASVFKKISIMELSIYIIFGLWEKLADHYVDYSGKLTRQQIIDMLKERANRVEMSYETYQRFLDDPKLSKRDMFRHRPTACKGQNGSESPTGLVADEKKSG